MSKVTREISLVVGNYGASPCVQRVPMGFYLEHEWQCQGWDSSAGLSHHPPLQSPPGDLWPCRLRGLAFRVIKIKQFPGRWGLIFLSPLWQELKGIWEEARDMNVSLFVEMMPLSQSPQDMALTNFIDSPPVVTHPLVNQEGGGS